ncbi:MAG: OmpW family outer membrane protein [Pseudomonadota bacterium]
MTFKHTSLAVGFAAVFAAGAASAQDNLVKFGVAQYTTNSRTSGITGIGVPPGADAETGDATTVLFEYERMVTPNIGALLVLGVPPKIKANATGSVAFLGEVMSARNVSPTAFAMYHFGAKGDTWRPYAGLGINYTRFTDIQSTLAPKVEMSDSVGWAVTGGVEYVLNERWSLNASATALRVKSKLVATGTTVLQTTIDFRPVVYSLTAAYRF